jgi:VanZ family protein
MVSLWLPVLLYGLAIILLSSIPIQTREAETDNLDKVGHLVEYGLFSYLWFRAICGSRPNYDRRYVALLILGLCAVFGILDENFQSLIPHRERDLWDWVMDVSGSAVTLAALLIRKSE